MTHIDPRNLVSTSPVKPTTTSCNHGSCLSWRRSQMVREVTGQSRVIPAASLLTLALGAAAFGAVAIGALAIGRLVVGRLLIKKARLGAL